MSDDLKPREKIIDGLCYLFCVVDDQSEKTIISLVDRFKSEIIAEHMKELELKEPENDFNYFIELSVTSAEGTQTFGCNADSREDAFEKFNNGLHDIVSSEVEVQALSDVDIEDIYE